MSFLYQVMQPDGRIMMQTNDPACVYSADIKRALQQAGYKIVQKEQPTQKQTHT